MCIRVAVITGASSGDGYNVALNDLPFTTEKLKEVVVAVEKAGRKVLILPGDASVEGDVRALIGDTVVGLEPSADVMLGFSSLNLYHKVRHLVRQNIEASNHSLLLFSATVQDWGIIVVNVRGSPSVSAYCAAKFAARGLTQSLAQEVAAHGITVNAYAPGPIETNMPDMFKAHLRSNPSTAVKPTPAVGFSGTPSDIAALMSYLASQESRFVTGQTIIVDGEVFFN